MNEQVIDPRFSLYHADCFDILPSIPDKSVDMICCDLPYGVTSHPEDIPLPLDKLWEQYERIIKDNGAILLFGQGMFYVDVVDSNRKLFRYDLVWDKVLTTGFLNANKMPLRRHEQIAVFYKKLPTYNPQFSKGGRFVVQKRRTHGTNLNTTTILRKTIESLIFGTEHYVVIRRVSLNSQKNIRLSPNIEPRSPSNY